MPVPNEITDILSELGLPAGAIALAAGLVRGARSLEKDASDRALKYIADLLIRGDATNVGKLGATLVPTIFDRIFGSRPLSFKFVSRSILATTIFWIMLLEVKHPDWTGIFQELRDNHFAPFFMPLWYITDWISLIKARLLIRLMLVRNKSVYRTSLFVLLDVTFSYLLTTLTLLIFVLGFWKRLQVSSLYEAMNILTRWTLEFGSLTDYLHHSGQNISLAVVVVPSTLFTSAWTIFMMISIIMAMLLVPIDQIRRFTGWWFRDLEKHPLTAIAKVAGTLIIAGAFAVKGFRWLAT